ncbi:MAG: dTDP-glucose 4,6-dehydratase [Patescibacteria group bacterium]|jgi:dTDP-glucose 4,6-dehydratase
MKILITGGAGFIGSNFIHYWLNNHKSDGIWNLDKLTYAGNKENLKDIDEDPRYHFIQDDICNLNLVKSMLEKEDIDVIVHFASQTHVDKSVLLIERGINNKGVNKLFEESIDGDFVLNNVWGTHILLEAAVKAWRNSDGTYAPQKRFHHISTDEVFGALSLEDKNKFNENTIYNPRSPYSASKAAADHLVRAYHFSFGLPVTISNCSNNYGPYMYPEKLLALAITNLIEGKKIPIYGDGKYVRDWLQVDDHCRAIEAILTKGKIGETYCLGGLTEDVNNLELIRMVLKIMGKGEENLEYVKDRPGHDRRYAVDYTKATNELGWRPNISLTEGLKAMIEWYIGHPEWWKPIKSGQYLEYYKKQYQERAK